MALIGSEVAGEAWPPRAGKESPAVDTYEVEINGVTTRMQLSDEEAEARGLKAAAKKVAAKKAAAPANKARATTADKRAAVAEKSWQGKK